MTDPQIPLSTPTIVPEIQGINILTPVLANPALLFLTTYWKIIVFALVLLFSGYEWLRIDSLKNQVKVAEIATQTVKDELKNCRTEVTTLSGKVADAAANSKKLQDQLDGLKPLLDNIRKTTDATAHKILNQPSPKTCEEIQHYIIDNQDDFGWKPKP